MKLNRGRTEWSNACGKEACRSKAEADRGTQRQTETNCRDKQRQVGKRMQIEANVGWWFTKHAEDAVNDFHYRGSPLTRLAQ